MPESHGGGPPRPRLLRSVQLLQPPPQAGPVSVSTHQNLPIHQRYIAIVRRCRAESRGCRALTTGEGPAAGPATPARRRCRRARSPRRTPPAPRPSGRAGAAGRRGSRARRGSPARSSRSTSASATAGPSSSATATARLSRTTGDGSIRDQLVVEGGDLAPVGVAGVGGVGVDGVDRGQQLVAAGAEAGRAPRGPGTRAPARVPRRPATGPSRRGPGRAAAPARRPRTGSAAGRR